MKLRVNLIQDDIENTEFMKPLLTTKGRFLTTAKYSTGTISVTNNSKTITGTGTSWTKSFKDRVIVFDDDDTVSYRIASVASTTSATLDNEYAGDTNVLATYNIYKDRYYLKRDVRGVMNMVDRENEQPLDIVSVFEGANPYDNPVDTDNGDGPTKAIILLDKNTYYSTGTIAITNGSAAVTGTTTDWTSEMVGMVFRVDSDSSDYEITAVGSTTSITFDRNYEGTTQASGGTYKISPPGVFVIQLYPMPEAQLLFDYEYRYKLPRLVNNNDVSLVTKFSDMALVFGSIWLMKENEDVDPTGSDRYLKLYEMAKNKMSQQTLELDELRQIIPYIYR